MIYHVSKFGCDSAAGTKEAPFKTINRAAVVATPGDTVQVHEGTYREWVDPKCGGLHEHCPIVYEAAPGEHPVIKGSEIVSGWERVEGTVWKKVLPNAMFGQWNPYAQKVEGDWMEAPKKYDVHLGDVYINGVSMFEATSLEDLYEAGERREFLQNGLKYDTEYVLHPELSIYRWYAQVTEKETTLLCNFQDIDPNENFIEINVRKCCFYPQKSGMNYITVRGFEMAHAACPFTPPTGDQVGMLGPNWSKGWVIENNHLHDAKCSAISIGKDGTTGDNLSTRYGRKSGHSYQMEAVFLAVRDGWSKERIGSHIIRNNIIHDCGQNAIVGHMGCVFSQIEHNHIYNISTKREYWGYEMAGIKLHAAVDVVIKNNNFHNCGLGIWLDWQAQGTRVTGNLFYDNDRDFMVEVTHGPCLVDHNIMLSKFAVDNHAQGTAFVHNLIAGVIRPRKILRRDTPYHFAHSTLVAGFSPVLGGDDRVMNNIFLGIENGRGEAPKHADNFSKAYDAYSTPEEYPRLLRECGSNHSHTVYFDIPQPVWIEGNAYAGYAGVFRCETGETCIDGATAELRQEDGKWNLTICVPETISKANCMTVTTARLGAPRLTEEPYENADGTPVDFTKDFYGNNRDTVIPGPFAVLVPGKQTFVVWQ